MISLFKFKQIITAFSLILLLSSCAFYDPEGRHFVSNNLIQLYTHSCDEECNDANKLKVAIIPFENWTNHPNAGQIAAQMIATELYTQDIFKLQEETQVKRLLDIKKVNMARLSKTSYARKIASMLHVDAVIMGSVSEYDYQHGLHEEPTVGLNARLISRAGIVMWASSHSEIGRGYLRRDSLNDAAQRAIIDMVAELVKKYKK
ncbi:MAG: hypothetical protein HN826_04200, partial [Methylococcales bacterium]|nr:hypothetical protein [Methylococcales bacterium]